MFEGPLSRHLPSHRGIYFLHFILPHLIYTRQDKTRHFKDDILCVQLGVGNSLVIAKGRCFKLFIDPRSACRPLSLGRSTCLWVVAWLPPGVGWLERALACGLTGSYPYLGLTNPVPLHCIDLPLIVLAHMPTTNNCLSQYLLPDDLI